MVALLHHAALIHDHNAVGMADGGQTVRYHQHRAVLAQARQRLLNGALGGVVQGRGSLIQQQNRRVLQECAGNRDALALPAGQLAAIAPHAGGQSAGHVLNELPGVGCFGGSDDGRLIGLRAAVGNVGGYAVIKQHHMLPHPAQLLA